MFLAPKLNIKIVTGKERSVATELTTAFNSKTYSVVKCFLQNYSGAPRVSEQTSRFFFPDVYTPPRSMDTIIFYTPPGQWTP